MRPRPRTPNPFFESEGHPEPLVLDGGLATALEARGFDLDDPLWSARLLIEAPQAIRRVHLDFLEAGADCIATASYQASLPGFAQRGVGLEEGIGLLHLATRLAVEARDAFWSGLQRGSPEHRPRRLRPLVAASVGPYGAYLADGSEYSGRYGVSTDTLYGFHRERWHLFAQGSADLLACETIPSLAEASVLMELMAETPERWAWLSVSCRDAAHLSDGTPVEELARRADGVPNLAAVGVNCTRPRFVLPLLNELRRHTRKPLLAYPNAGEDYDAETGRWVPSPAAEPSGLDWGEAARGWVAAGARGVGGCCRVGPESIRRIREALGPGPG